MNTANHNPEAVLRALPTPLSDGHGWVKLTELRAKLDWGTDGSGRRNHGNLLATVRRLQAEGKVMTRGGMASSFSVRRRA